MDILPATLRTETDALCSGLERLQQQLEAKTVAFEEAKQLWESSYQPEAHKLAEALLRYLPDNDPRLMMVSRVGNERTFKADVVNCIEASFYGRTAWAQLDTVRNQLRKLAAGQ